MIQNERRAMKPYEAFGVVVRSIGLLFLLPGVGLILWGLLYLVLGGPGSAVGMFISAVPALFVGVWFLQGAQLVMEFAYPELRPPGRRQQMQSASGRAAEEEYGR
jgi:hypothetical protein